MKVIFVVGPTASGKSARALVWAQRFGGTIVNCDSIQCYRELDIGSAKPTAEELAKVPHELISYIPVGESLTAGAYSRDFFEVLERLERQEVPVVFVVGGTGFYFQAIEKGMYSVGAANPQIVDQVEAEIAGGAADRLWEELNRRDPQTADRIARRDHYRLARAIEMIRSHGKTPSEVRSEFLKNQKPFPYPLLKIGIRASRQQLDPVVLARAKSMLSLGLLSEVQRLLERGLEDWSPLQSVGYRQALDYILGKSRFNDMGQLAEEIAKATLQLAKKQRTWFQRDPAIHWFEFQTDPAIGAEDAVTTISEFLASP